LVNRVSFAVDSYVLLTQRRVDGRGVGRLGGELPLQVVRLAGQLLDQLTHPRLCRNRAQDLFVRRHLSGRLGGGPRRLLVDRGLHLDELGVVGVEQFSQFGERLRLLRNRRRGRGRWLWWHERRRGITVPSDRPAEPGTQLVTGANQQQRVTLSRVALVHGLVADPADVVEPAAHPLGKKTLVAEHLQA
jgi:hypothetical protein